ncbi:MAG: hypothetical protein ABJB40_04855, partial [Acidobacteriota bacterium]
MFTSIHFSGSGRRITNASKPEVLEKLRAIVGPENVVVDPEKVEPYGADAVKEKFPPEAVVFPESTAQMVAILKLANEYLFPMTARGGANVSWPRKSDAGEASARALVVDDDDGVRRTTAR